MELDIITNLGESHYVACGKGVIMARRCMKQRYVELGFTKTVSNDRAIYINKLVTVGLSEHVLTARVIEHAQKRKRQRETSKQRRLSKANKQMTAMGITVGGLRSDSGDTGKGAGAEGEEGAEIAEAHRLGKLIPCTNGGWHNSACRMQREEEELSGRAYLNSWRNISYMELHCMN